MSEDGAIRRGRPQNELVSSGLADLDVLMGDGIPQGYAVLVVVPAGELALRLTESFILGGLTGGEGLILTLSTLSTQEFASRTARYNIDLAALGDRARIIDWYSWRRERFTGIRDEGQTTKISKDLVNVEVAVTRAKRKLMKATEHRRAVFDFLGPALADYERQEALDITRSIIAKMRADKITSFWLLAGERVHEKELAGLLDLFDGVVMVQGKGDEFALQILNLRARPFSRERHSLKMGMDGSLVVGLVPMSRSESVESQSAAAAPPGGDEGHGFSFSVKATGRPPGGSVEPTPSRHEPPKAETKAKGTTPTEEIRPRRVVERDTSEETPESQEAPEAAIPQSVPAQPPRSPAAAAALARHPPPRVVRSVPPIPPPISRPSRPAAPRKSRIPAATSAVALVILLLLGVLLYFMPLGQRHDISVDGGFDDWSPFVILKDDDGPRRPGGVELKEYGLHRDNGRLCAYARTSAPLAAGVGGRIIILIDEDGRPGTGYSSRLLDADASMTVIGNQDKFTGTFSEFNEQGNERLNWSRWKPGPGFAVADAGDGRVESCLESDPTAAGAFARVAVVGPKGIDDVSRCDLAPDRACVIASLAPVGYTFAAGADAFELSLAVTGGAAEVSAVTLAGGQISSYRPSAPPWKIADSVTAKFRVQLSPAGLASGQLATLRISSVTESNGATITVSRENGSAYFQTAPAGVVIDGLVDDWAGLPKVVSPVAGGSGPFSADLRRVATSPDATSARQSFLVQFHRPALEGTPVPGKHLPPSSGGSGTVVPLPRITGEDVVRALIDSDNSTATGEEGTLKGADWRVTVRGANGMIKEMQIEKWESAGWKLAPAAGGSARVSPDGLEFAALKSALGIAGPFQYLIEATDWSEVWDRAGSADRDPMVVRPDGTGWRGDMGSWSGFGLPALAEGRNWVDMSVARDGQAFLLRDDGDVYFTDGSGSGANWVRQTGTRPAGSGGVSWVGIDVRRNFALPLATYILRNDGLVISALTGTTGTAGAAWGAASSSSPPAGTAYVDIALSRQTAGLFAILRNNGGVFYSTGAAWTASPITGLTVATDYVSISALRGSCSGGANDNAMAVMRASGEVRCVRDPTNAAGTWIAYGTGGGGLPAAGSWVSLADDDPDDVLYAMRNNGVVYRSDGTGPTGSWSVAGGTGTAVPVSTAYVAVGGPGRNAATADRAFVLRKNGEVYRNDDTSTNTAWNLFGSGTSVPAGGGAWVSIGSRDGVGAFLLAANGTVMRSDDLGGTWSLFGDADPDYSWVTIDVTQTYVYVMANDGWVERAPVATGVFAGWSILKTWSTADASWVSLGASLDGFVTNEIRALRNDGLTEIASELVGNWGPWGDADAAVGRFNLVGIASDGANAYAVSNTGAVSVSPTSSASWGVNAGSWTSPANASFVDLAATESAAGFVWILRNNGEVWRSSDSANSFPARGFLSGAAEGPNAGYVSLAAIPERAGAILAATAMLCPLSLLIAFSRRRRGS